MPEQIEKHISSVEAVVKKTKMFKFENVVRKYRLEEIEKKERKLNTSLEDDKELANGDKQKIEEIEKEERKARILLKKDKEQVNSDKQPVEGVPSLIVAFAAVLCIVWIADYNGIILEEFSRTVQDLLLIDIHFLACVRIATMLGYFCSKTWYNIARWILTGWEVICAIILLVAFSDTSYLYTLELVLLLVGTIMIIWDNKGNEDFVEGLIGNEVFFGLYGAVVVILWYIGVCNVGTAWVLIRRFII